MDAFAVLCVAIALERPIKIDKSASALFGRAVYAVTGNDQEAITHQLRETIGRGGILFLLRGCHGHLRADRRPCDFQIIISTKDKEADHVRDQTNNRRNRR